MSELLKDKSLKEKLFGTIDNFIALVPEEACSEVIRNEEKITTKKFGLQSTRTVVDAVALSYDHQRLFVERERTTTSLLGIKSSPHFAYIVRHVAQPTTGTLRGMELSHDRWNISSAHEEVYFSRRDSECQTSGSRPFSNEDYVNVQQVLYDAMKSASGLPTES